MPLERPEHLIIGISSSALFNQEEENRIYEEKGEFDYNSYQSDHEGEILEPGTGFQIVKAFSKINTLLKSERKTETIIMSRNSADSGLRLFNSIENHGLEISRAAFLGGAGIKPYLYAFDTDLFLSTNDPDIRQAVNANIAAGKIMNYNRDPQKEISKVKLSFNVKAIRFSDESEKIYQNYGMSAFLEYEKLNIQKTLPDGPYAKLFKIISAIQEEFSAEAAPVRLAVLTSSRTPVHERVTYALRAWNVRVDEAFYMGGTDEDRILEAFGTHIFFGN